MNTRKFFIEVGHSQINKYKNIVCGDCILLKRISNENRYVSVLSDGLGSGVKANVLSTMTASMAMNFMVRREDISRTVQTIMDTLPVDSVRNISYSTFTIVDVDNEADARIVEFDNPPILLVRNGVVSCLETKPVIIRPKNILDGDNYRTIRLAQLRLQKEDRLIFYSDGVSQSGIGNKTMPFGWEEEALEYIGRLINVNPKISALELAHRIVKQSEINDILKAKDDTSCVVYYVRDPRRLLICSGPPFSENKDKYLADLVRNYKGKKIVCGGTTSQILSRELGKEITVNLDDLVSGLPPTSQMEGIDLMTEGIITLGSLMEIISQGMPKEMNEKGPAWDIFRMIIESDIIDIVVGTKINVAHQDPSLPVELEIRRGLMKRIASTLEEKFMKDVRIEFI